jgi:anti-sigma B factor antagonist
MPPMPESGAAPVLTINVERYGADDLAVVRCHGKLVAGVTQLLYNAVNDLVPETQRVVLDLSDVSYTDSMGLGILVRLFVTVKSAGCTLELLNLSKQVRHLLGMTNTLAVFPVIDEDSLEFG